jgi:phosphatidylserine/phosphatidylglycerophosphate/cardiolipin synthase-like enzyme
VECALEARTFKKNRALPLILGGILLFHAGLIFWARKIPLPSEKHPLHFYSNQTRDNIHRLFSHALTGAKKSIYVSVYGISDPTLLRLFAKSPVNIRIEYDPSASLPLKERLPNTIDIQPIKGKGLMHRKIVVIDDALVFLGSANFTTTSLKHHANLVIGFHHPPLARYLQHPFSNAFSFTVGSLNASLFLLPDPSQQSLTTLLRHLESAQHSIQIAMFTLTHAQIADALIAAKARGVAVEVAIDYYTARGASKKTLKRLLDAGISLHLSQGKELLHHKWGLIDSTTLITGSANWTKAAFTKNRDFLLVLSPLSPSSHHFFHNLWTIITTESTPTSNVPV